MKKPFNTIAALEQRLCDVMEDADIVIWEYDAETHQYIYVNQLAERLLGYPEHRWLDNGFFQHCIIHPDDLEKTRRLMKQVIQDDHHRRHEYRLRASDGTIIWVSEHIKPIYSDSGEIAGLRGLIHDVNETRRLKNQLLRITNHDDLTGLPNRNALETRLQKAIAAARRNKNQLSLLFLDLDCFKDINYSLGHDVGDSLLKTVAERLTALLRSSDTAVRFSGDSFCILLENLQDEYLPAKIAQRCLKKIAQPVLLDKYTIYPRISIGIALYPKDGQSADQLLQSADNAVATAKENSKHSYSFYSKEMTLLAKKRLHLENDLRRAIMQNQLILHYQPQVSIQTGKLESVEALVRWHHPELGLLGPGEFIPVAEKSGLIVALGEWVMDNACRQLAIWKSRRVPVKGISINLSGTHFCDHSLLSTLTKVLDKYHIQSDELVIEITEAVTQDSDKSRDNFEKLKTRGFKLAIDDFGTGFSSLSSLSRLPITCLKIDRSFIHNALHDPKDATIIATILSMGRNLGFSIVAEGVENPDQLRYLNDIGCDTAQGFFLSPPVSEEKIPLLAEKNYLLPEITDQPAP